MNRHRFVILLFIVVIAATGVGMLAGSATAQSSDPPRGLLSLAQQAARVLFGA